MKISSMAYKYESRSFGFASKNFYAEFIAALDVERNAKQYFPDLVREKRWQFDEVQLGKSVSWSHLRKKTGLSSDELYRYNTALRKPVQKGRVRVPKGFFVKVPKGKGPKLVASLGHGKVLTLAKGTEVQRSLTKEIRSYTKSSTKKYRVKRGDTVGGIAGRYGVSQKALMRANRIKDPRRLYAGRVIVIPGHYSSSGRKKSKKRYASGGTYKVKKGDTVGSIAASFGVSQKKLMKLNGITDPRKLYVGRKLKIPSKKSTASSPRNGSTYVVKRGDNLTRIARNHGVSVAAIRSKNPKAGNSIYPGQKLVIP